MYIIIPGPMKTQIVHPYHVLDCNNDIVGGDRTRHQQVLLSRTRGVNTRLQRSTWKMLYIQHFILLKNDGIIHKWLAISRALGRAVEDEKQVTGQKIVLGVKWLECMYYISLQNEEYMRKLKKVIPVTRNCTYCQNYNTYYWKDPTVQLVL